MTSPRSMGTLKSSSAGSMLDRPSDRSRSERMMPGHWNLSTRLKRVGTSVNQSTMLVDCFTLLPTLLNPVDKFPCSRSEEQTSELQSPPPVVIRRLLSKKTQHLT